MTCPRCRMDLIRFTSEVRLPRFTMRVGDTWHLPQCRYLADGSAELGGGVAHRGSFVIEEVDAQRTCQCPCDGTFVDRRA